MKRNNMKWRLGAVVIVLAITVGAVVVFGNGGKNKYEGLVTHIDVTFAEGERELLEQQLAVLEESLARQIEAGEGVDETLYVDIARTASTLGDLVKARETYETYLNINVLNLAPRLNYARVLMDMHDYESAEDAYKQILAAGGAYEGTFRGLIEAIEAQNEDGARDQEVKNALDVATEVLGQTPWIMAQLAEWYNAHGDCERAIAHLEVIEVIAESEDARELARQDIRDLRATCGR